MLDLFIFIVCLTVIWHLFFPTKFKNFTSQYSHSFDKSTAVASDYVAKQFISYPESLCLAILQQIIKPNEVVFAQVSMGALLDLGPDSLRQVSKSNDPVLAEKQARSSFSNKIIDFVIYDTTAKKIICVIELDDSTHLSKSADDAYRDLMLKVAGYLTVRIPFKSASEITTEYVSTKLSKGGYNGSKK